MPDKSRRSIIETLPDQIKLQPAETDPTAWNNFVENIYDMSNLTPAAKAPFQSPPRLRRACQSPVSSLQDIHQWSPDDEALWLQKTLNSTSTQFNGQSFQQSKKANLPCPEIEVLVSKAMELMDYAMTLDEKIKKLQKQIKP